jgi:hypothetical protein
VKCTTNGAQPAVSSAVKLADTWAWAMPAQKMKKPNKNILKMDRLPLRVDMLAGLLVKFGEIEL